MRLAIVYFTREGQTARIAAHIAARLTAAGHEVACQSGAELSDLAAYDAILVGASIHYGHHSLAALRWVRRHRQVLAGKPTGLFSVSLCGGGPGARPEAAGRYLANFQRHTGWHPALMASFGGALPYSRYSSFNRFLVRLFVRMAGGDTDVSRDYEYTDWQAVDAFADRFLEALS